jgi:hypothetical protein
MIATDSYRVPFDRFKATGAPEHCPGNPRSAQVFQVGINKPVRSAGSTLAQLPSVNFGRCTILPPFSADSCAHRPTQVQLVDLTAFGAGSRPSFPPIFFGNFHVIDVTVILAYLALVIYLGHRGAQQGGGSDGFFLAGRKLGKLYQFSLNFGNATNANGAVSTASLVHRQGASGVWLGLGSSALERVHRHRVTISS